MKGKTNESFVCVWFAGVPGKIWGNGESPVNKWLVRPQRGGKEHAHSGRHVRSGSHR